MRATAQQETQRERIRAADPDFTRLVDRLRARTKSPQDIRVIWLVTATEAFGKVPDDVRARVQGRAA